MDIKDLMADRLQAIDDQRAKDMQEFAEIRVRALIQIREHRDTYGEGFDGDAGRDFIALMRVDLATRTLLANWSLIRWTAGLGVAVETPSGEWILIRPAAIDHPDYPALKPGDIVPDNYKLIPTASNDNG